MSYQRGIVIGSLSVVLAAAAPAQAQIGTYVRPQINPRPTVSPYLNLQRGGNAALNYYGVVRPQLDTNRAIFQLQQDAAQLGQGGFVVPLDPAQNAALLSAGQTGHPVSFQNYSHYYGNRGGGGGGTNAIAGGTGNPIGRPNPGVRPIIVGTTNPQ